MKNRSLQEWGVLADIVGAIAVVVSLLFVAYSINQNTKVLEVSAWEHFLDRTQLSNQMLAESADLARIVAVGTADPDALTVDEHYRFVHFARMRFGAWESTYGYFQLGRIDTRSWETWNMFYLDVLDKPGYRKVWLEIRDGYDSDFRNALEATYMNGHE